MNEQITAIMNINENQIRVMRIENEDYISLTDIAKYKNPDDPSDVIKKRLSNYDTVEFLGLWEELSNENFNSAEFSRIKREEPKKSFTMTPSKWCTDLNAIGITYSKGKYSVGTFAHSDIALEFASWIDNNINQSERLEKLNAIARKELSILSKDNNIFDIEKIDNRRLVEINKSN